MKKTKRKDHYIPQGYLRGFIDPSREKHPRPLWRFEVATNTWSSRSTKEVGHLRGFYDYAGPGALPGNETADSTFLKLENDYPIIRKELVSSGFARWMEHREFLLNFMQMMRARSTLFRRQKVAEGKTLQAYVIEEVYHDRNAIKLKSMTPSPVPPAFIKNRAIIEMREEIQKGAAWLKDFYWALRFTDSIADPFIISELPFVAEGSVVATGVELKEALDHPDTLLMFPLCWQACLFGSRRRFDVETDKFGPEDMRNIRKRYRDRAEKFLLSPIKVDEF